MPKSKFLAIAFLKYNTYPGQVWPRFLVMPLTWALGLILAWGALAAANSDDRDFDLPGSARPVEVRVSFHLIDLQRIDEEAEAFEFSGIMTLKWKDERQAFDPVEAGVAEKLYHGHFQVNELSPAWYPQVILANASKVEDAQGILLRVAPDGSCTLIRDLHVLARNELRLRRYPFDRQRLEAIFQVLGFDRSQVTLVGDGNPVSAEIEAIRVPQWKLETVTGNFHEIKAPYHLGAENAATFVLTLDVKRQSFFVVRMVIVPLLIIVILSWCVFWMNRSSLFDRMSVTFVGLLTAVAFQSMTGDFMPHISYVTFINAFISLSFLIMAATAGVNLLVCLYDRNEKEALGDRIDSRSRWIFPILYAGLIFLAYCTTFYFF
jgi:hypothetical protein